MSPILDIGKKLLSGLGGLLGGDEPEELQQPSIEAELPASENPFRTAEQVDSTSERVKKNRRLASASVIRGFTAPKLGTRSLTGASGVGI